MIETDIRELNEKIQRESHRRTETDDRTPFDWPAG